MPAASWEHGIISARVFLHLGVYVRENQLGEVVTPDTGFRVGERVLKPDVAFLSTAHLPDDPSKACPVPPDLAIEVCRHQMLSGASLKKHSPIWRREHRSSG